MACAPLITTHLVVTPRGGVGGLGKWVNSLLFSIGVALGGVEHNIQTPCEGGGSEIFLKGVQPITRAEDHAEWIPVPELKTSSAWGILFFISGTNESRGIFPIPPSVGPPTAVFAPYSL